MNCDWPLRDTTEVNPQPPIRSEIDKKVFAVSAIRSLPKSNVIEPNTLNYERFDKPYELPVLVRFGTHFSLGEMVRPHKDGSWDDRLIAIVKPLSGLDGVININPYDTLVLGNVLLTSDTTLVVPKGTVTNAEKYGYKIFEYDPDKMNLRTAVDRVIEDRQGLHIRMKENVNDQVDAEFEIDGQTYKTGLFFKEFLKDKPHVSIGNEIRSVNGQAFRFGIISQALTRYLRSFKSMSNDFGQQYFNFQLRFIEHNIKSLLNSGVLVGVSNDVRANVLSNLQIVNGMLNIGRLDQYLRTKYSKTLVNTDLTLKIWRAKGDFELLKKTVESNQRFISRLQETDSDLEPRAFSSFYAVLLANLPKDERDQFIAQNSDVLPHDLLKEILRDIQIILEKNQNRIKNDSRQRTRRL